MMHRYETASLANGLAKVTINCDMGEAFSTYGLGDYEACMPFITHANIAAVSRIRPGRDVEEVRVLDKNGKEIVGLSNSATVGRSSFFLSATWRRLDCDPRRYQRTGKMQGRGMPSS